MTTRVFVPTTGRSGHAVNSRPLVILAGSLGIAGILNSRQRNAEARRWREQHLQRPDLELLMGGTR